MAGPLARRSGIAICLIMELLEFEPKSIHQIGIGQNHFETEVFYEAWPNVRLVGCEPHPEILNVISKTYPGEIIPTAIGNFEGRATLWSKLHHKDGSSLYEMPGAAECKRLQVPVTRIDTLWPDGPYALPSLLWLDCEGNELDALRGGEQFVKSVDVVNVELTNKPFGPDWCSSMEVHNWLLGHGFLRQWVHTQRSSAGQMDGIYVRPQLFKPEYCACPCMVEKFNA